MCYGLVNSKGAAYILEYEDGWVDKNSGPNERKTMAFNWH